MKKYLIIYKNSIKLYFVNKINLLIWRFRNVLSVLFTYYLWNSIYHKSSNIFGYSKDEMLTYVMMIILVGSIVLSTQAFKIAEEINYGKLSDYLIKPIDYFHYNLIRDLADKSINIFFAFFEMIFFYIIFKPVLLFPQNIINIIWFITFLIAAVLLYYQLSISLSFIGFWSRETWAPRFLFLIIVSFLSGTYFPLNIFPNALYFMIKILPFTYLIYFPITVFLEKQTTQSIVSALVIILTWNFILYFLNKILWKKGLKIYTAEGL